MCWADVCLHCGSRRAFPAIPPSQLLRASLLQCLSPLLIFCAVFFYSDLPSVALVVCMSALSIGKYHNGAAIAAVMALSQRQTNAVWIGADVAVTALRVARSQR